jgi:hypothetical protein
MYYATEYRKTPYYCVASIITICVSSEVVNFLVFIIKRCFVLVISDKYLT